MSPDPADPRLSDAEVDARFADLVAGWSPVEPTEGSVDGGPRDGDGGLPPAPDPSGGVTTTSSPEAIDPPPGRYAGPPAESVGSPPPSITLSFPVWRGASGPPIDEVVAAEEDEGFTPPPVHLPPAEDLHYWGALGGLVAGPLLVIWVVLAHPFYATWWALAGAALFVAGFLLMVLRGPRERDPEDDDNGARV